MELSYFRHTIPGVITEQSMSLIKAIAEREKVLHEIQNEWICQEKKFDGHTEDDWVCWISEYANGVEHGEKYSFRTRMIKVAAFAVAAIEALDRRA